MVLNVFKITSFLLILAQIPQHAITGCTFPKDRNILSFTFFNQLLPIDPVQICCRFRNSCLSKIRKSKCQTCSWVQYAFCKISTSKHVDVSLHIQWSYQLRTEICETFVDLVVLNYLHLFNTTLAILSTKIVYVFKFHFYY